MVAGGGEDLARAALAAFSLVVFDVDPDPQFFPYLVERFCQE